MASAVQQSAAARAARVAPSASIECGPHACHRDIAHVIAGQSAEPSRMMAQYVGGIDRTGHACMHVIMCAALHAHVECHG